LTKAKVKRKPVREILLEDEIPPMPKSHELIGQPNDSHYEKQEKELKDKIDGHKNNVKKIREKMEAEKARN